MALVHHICGAETADAVGHFQGFMSRIKKHVAQIALNLEPF